ncbi:hypothetical protein, partial [Salmonella sp. s55004]|uniref:hypothetical protein n=1 Tax=Salmonella sp. s55004 TaxID=3159675 RepID=UPI00397F274A
ASASPKKRQNQIKKTSYAQTQQIRRIRGRMIDIITKECQNNDLKEVVNKLLPDSIAHDIEKACHSIYPLHDVLIRKVKVLRKPKFDIGRLLELHGEGTTKATGEGEESTPVERPEGYEPPIQENV